MKFELFGRLRDNNGEDGSDDSGFGGGGFGGNDFGSDSAGFSGGSLERTVDSMFSQGYSESEIKQELEGQYSQTEIDQAINNAVTSSATGQSTSNQGGPEPMTPYQKQDDEAVSPMDEGYSAGNGNSQNQEFDSSGFDSGNYDSQPAPEPQPQPQQPQPVQQDSTQQAGGTVDPSIEELIETIVAENIQRIDEEFENLYSELDIIEETLESLDQRVHDLEVRDDEDQQQFIQKVDEMEDHIDSYQSRIGGLEKAFQQVLPSLVDNVRDLTSLVQEIKREKGIETDTDVSESDIKDLDVEDW